VLREGVEPLLEELSVHVAEPRGGDVDLPHEIGALGDIDRDLRQRLVHGDERLAEAADAREIAERFRHRLAQHDPRVFGRVVQIDVQVALGAELHVDERMLGEALQHVVEKADTRRDVERARAVEIDGGRNVRLARLALD